MDIFRTLRSSPAPEEMSTVSLPHCTPLTRTEYRGKSRELLEAGALLGRGRYVVEDVLGSGGEGVVYRALDRAREETVAIKMLHVTDPSALPHLKHEFRFLRDLVHPHLVQLHELVIERHQAFFSMSYVEGTDFLSASRTPDQLRTLLGQLADVLSFLHRTGRVHRDVKPTNVLVDERGHLTLLDFGLGMDMSDEAARHRAVGTPRYMAPEVLSMEGASAKSDAYALGLFIYEALTQRHPNESGRTELSQRAPFDVRQVQPEAPADLAHLCQLLTHPDPQHRESVECVLSHRRSTIHFSTFPPRHASGQEVFAGRHAEMQQLQTALSRVRSGWDPIIVRLEARSGMGKSALLRHFLDQRLHEQKNPEDGEELVVLRGRCSEHELSPHMAIDGVLEDLVRHLGQLSEDEQLALIPAADAALLTQLFPELCQLKHVPQSEPRRKAEGDYREMRRRAYQALSRALRQLGQRQLLVLAIDDVQWGDADSGRLLREIFFGSTPPRCLLLLAYRTEEQHASACLRELFESQAESHRGPSVAHVGLGPLVSHEVDHLLEQLLDDASAPAARTIREESEGAPLLVTELAAHVAQDGSLEEHDWRGSVIDRLVELRLASVPPEVEEGFAFLCCAGVPTDVAFLADLVDMSPEALARSLETARLARSRRGGTALVPIHDAISESMRKRCQGSLSELHRRLGEALVARKADPSDIARHFEACGDTRTSHFAEIAADQASRSFALDRSISLYRLALDTHVGPATRAHSLRERLANALASAGRGAEAAPLYEQLAQDVELDRGIELRRCAAEQWLITGHAEQGTQALRAVHHEVGLNWPKTAPRALASLLAHRAALAVSGKHVVERAAAQPPSKSKKAKRQLEACRAAWSISMVSVMHGAANSCQYLRLALKARDPFALQIGSAMEAMYHAANGPRRARSTYHWLAQSEKLRPEGDSYSEAFSAFSIGQAEYLLGNFQGALDSLARAEALFLGHGRNVAWELNSARILWSDALYYQGELNQLAQCFARWIPDGRERGDRYVLSALTLSQAPCTLLQDGDVELARAQIEEGASLWRAPYVSYQDLSELVVRSYVDVYAGQPRKACKRLETAARSMRQSFLDQVHVARVQVGVIEAMAHLEAAADRPNDSERRTHLKVVRRIATNMLGEGATWSTALGTQLRALADLIETPDESALERLKESGRLFSSCGMKLQAAGVEARVGELVGGDEGQERLDAAYHVFESERIHDWVRALSCVTPRVLPR